MTIVKEGFNNRVMPCWKRVLEKHADEAVLSQLGLIRHVCKGCQHAPPMLDVDQIQLQGAYLIDLFRLYILFSQYRSCDNTQENWCFVFLITKSVCRHIHAGMRCF